MEPDPDELAGVVDLFGGLTREELRGAYADLAARSGEEFDLDVLAAAVDRAIEGYYLVAVEGEVTDDSDEERVRESEGSGDDEALLVAGPASLPTLPEGGDDLPHLVDAERRTVDPDVVGRAALSRLQGDAARAVNEEDDERIATLLDVCYDLEAWAPVETAALRDRLDAVQ